MLADWSATGTLLDPTAGVEPATRESLFSFPGGTAVSRIHFFFVGIYARKSLSSKIFMTFLLLQILPKGSLCLNPHSIF